jgi:hypothetical protein
METQDVLLNTTSNLSPIVLGQQQGNFLPTISYRLLVLV